jgi:hypothetical protein
VKTPANNHVTLDRKWSSLQVPTLVPVGLQLAAGRERYSDKPEKRVVADFSLRPLWSDHPIVNTP